MLFHSKEIYKKCQEYLLSLVCEFLFRNHLLLESNKLLHIKVWPITIYINIVKNVTIMLFKIKYDINETALTSSK